MDLFGTDIPQKIYAQKKNVFERKAALDARIASRIAKRILSPAPTNYGQFSKPETSQQFVGQNLYIKPNYIVSMPEYCYFDRATGEIHNTNPAFESEAFLENQKNLLQNDRLGQLSRKAVSGLRNAINWLCLAAQPKPVLVKKTGLTFKFKVNFITLTLPDTMEPINSATLQKRALNPWLVYMRKYHDLKNYVWRLEFQANGKLHVHITTDTFIHLKIVRSIWNRLLKKHGFLKEFHASHGHYEPNSTDIHATKSIKNLAGYLSKYMAKKNDLPSISQKRKRKRAPYADRRAWYKQRLIFWNSPLNPRPIKGRIWSCNYELSQAGKCQVHVQSPDCAHELAPLMQGGIEWKPLNTVAKPLSPARKIGELFFLKAKDWTEKMTGIIKDTYEQTRLTVVGLPRHYTLFELE